MPEYKLLSDAILDGSKLRPQTKHTIVDPRNRTCALGAAAHAVLGELPEDLDCLDVFWESLFEKTTCPHHGCYFQKKGIEKSLLNIVTHLNDRHGWSREQIAGFVATIEERLGLVEIISDEMGQPSSSSVAVGAHVSTVAESVSCSLDCV